MAKTPNIKLTSAGYRDKTLLPRARRGILITLTGYSTSYKKIMAVTCIREVYFQGKDDIEAARRRKPERTIRCVRICDDADNEESARLRKE